MAIPHNQLRSRNVIEQHEHCDEADARRIKHVDEFGSPINTQNPLPVRLTDGSLNIGSVNAQLEVQLSHAADTPDPGDVPDSVQIGDGQDILEVNPDGSINVNVVTGSSSNTKNFYNEVSSVVSSTPTTVVSYTAPVGKVSFLDRVFVSGTNIAAYSVKRKGTVIDKKRSYFGAALNVEFSFFSGEGSLNLDPGDVIIVEVEHFRPNPGDFNGRIQVIEV